MELDFSNDVIEKLLLKKALSDKNWLSILSKTYDKRWFKVKDLGVVLKLVLTYYNKYESIPSSKIIIALAKKYAEKHPDDVNEQDAQSLLNEVSSLELGLSEQVLTSNLKEFIRKNAFYNSLFDNAEILEHSPENYAKVVDKCLENFDRVQKLTFCDTDLGMEYFNKDAMLKHWDYIDNPSAKIPTGWKSIDNYTNGGFLKDGKMLAIFMAQAGLGKSLFLSNLAVNLLKQNLSVVVISLEMSQDVYAQRFDAHISSKNINKLAENHEEAVKRIESFYAKYPKAKQVIKE